ncbi:MAG: hypothetical protein JKX81_07325, partial [Arenicella sp.]|nr:hypothetical protein [Arenicella sp.]
SLSNDLFNSSLLDFYDGVVDDAVILHYEKLDRKYKNAKFILTVRETGRWKNSIKFDWNRTDANVPANSRDLSNQLKHHFTLRKKIFDVLTFDEAAVLRTYDDHYHRVIDYFKTRPDDLLVINIYAGEGWDKLCNFLNLPIPDAKFPYAGKREPIS